MQAEQVLLVQTTFKRIEADAAAALFYARLFELDPGLRKLFKRDLQEQGRMLMSMIGLAVGSLDRPEHIVDAVRKLGARHAGYGVRPEHYATVGSALLWTLEQGLGAEFTAEAKAAWSAAYGLLSNVMIEAARAP